MVDQRVRRSNEPVWDLFGDAVQELVEQARRKQYEVVQGHATPRESANGYTEFLESLFLYYRESVRTTESRAESPRHSSSVGSPAPTSLTTPPVHHRARRTRQVSRNP